MQIEFNAHVTPVGEKKARSSCGVNEKREARKLEINYIQRSQVLTWVTDTCNQDLCLD